MEQARAQVVEHTTVGTVDVTVVELPEQKQFIVVMFDKFNVRTERLSPRRPSQAGLDYLVKQHIRFSMSKTGRN